MNYLSEVKTFASLNHANIVQYKAAWLELGANSRKNVIINEDDTYLSDFTESDNDPKFKKQKDKEETYIYPDVITEMETSFRHNRVMESSDFEVSFHSNKSKHYSYSNEEDVLHSKRKRTREKRSSISEGGNAICTIEEIKNLKLNARPHPKWATLYIQMALCQMTLKQWLDRRNSAEFENSESALVPVKGNRRSDTIMEILHQLLRGK